MAPDEQPGRAIDPYPQLPAAQAPALQYSGILPQPGFQSPAYGGHPVLPEVRYASFGRRVLAYVIDAALAWVIIGILWLVGVLLLTFTAGSNYMNSASATGAVFLLLWGAMAITLQLYFGLFPLSAATPGMRVVGLRVVESSLGGKPGFWHSQLRALFFTLNILGFWGLLFFLDCLSVTWDGRHQASHDKAGRVVLIQAEYPVAFQGWQPAGQVPVA